MWCTIIKVTWYVNDSGHWTGRVSSFSRHYIAAIGFLGDFFRASPLWDSMGKWAYRSRPKQNIAPCTNWYPSIFFGSRVNDSTSSRKKSCLTKFYILFLGILMCQNLLAITCLGTYYTITLFQLGKLHCTHTTAALNYNLQHALYFGFALKNRRCNIIWNAQHKSKFFMHKKQVLFMFLKCMHHTI